MRIFPEEPSPISGHLDPPAPAPAEDTIGRADVAHTQHPVLPTWGQNVTLFGWQGPQSGLYRVTYQFHGGVRAPSTGTVTVVDILPTSLASRIRADLTR